MAQPFFSVIVPVYKAEAYLRQCVDSVLEQTFPDLEVILVDDGSPDGSGAICDEYAARDPRVKVIHKENGGNVSARRAGYAVSTGRYMVHVDSDDYIAPDLLETVFQQFRDHQVDAVLFGYRAVSPDGERCKAQGVPAGIYRGQAMQTVWDNLIIGADYGPSVLNCLWSMVVRRELFAPHLQAVPETIYRGEDLAATAPTLVQCSAVTVLDSFPYYYRQTPGSIMRTVRGDEAQQAVLLAQYLEEKLGKAYAARLNFYVTAELYPCLKRLALEHGAKEYRLKVKQLVTPEMRARLKAAKSNPQGHISDKVVFFLLRRGWFGLFRRIVTLRN